MVFIKEVQTKKQQSEFVKFPLKLYKNNPYFVPPLYGDEMAMFKKNYVYHDQCKSKFFLAYDENGKVVGRIHAILQQVANEKWGQKRIRFTRFDSIDSQEVANALFAAVENWAKELSMEEVVGPLGFSDLEREGLLIEGFDQLSTFEEQYNYDYYPRLIENLGYQKDIDWVERQIRAPKEVDERLLRISTKMLEKYNLKFGQAKNTNDFIKKYGDGIFEILDDTYEDLYGTVPFTEGMKKMLIANFKLIVDIKYTAVIVDENDKIVCFALCFPSIAKAVQKSGGRLTPACLIRLLKALKSPKILDLALIGVVKEYRLKGVASAMMAQLMNILKNGIEYAETNLNLEDNSSIQNQWKNFDSVLHKRRRSYVKKINQ